MAFPASLDVYTNQIDNSDYVLAADINGVQGDGASNGGIEAIEAKLGIDSSAVATSIDYLLKSASSIDPGHCFDEETEILTKRGWLKYTDININDEVLTLNQTYRFLEWNKINEVFMYDHFRELYKIDGVNFDLLVTNKHGLVALDNDKLDLFTAEDLYNKPINKNFIVAGYLYQNGINLTDDELRLLVWIVTDGSMDYDIRDSKTRIRFKLSKERKIRRLSELLNTMELSYSVLPANKCGINKLQPYRINIHSMCYGQNYPSIQRILDFLEYKKELPQKLKGLSEKQVEILFKEYSVTDGSIVSKASLQITSMKEVEIDLLQEIAITNGYRCNKTQGLSGIFRVNIFNNSMGRFSGKIKKIAYEGNVWCVNVNNGTLVVRRHGKVCITQNTHSLLTNLTVAATKMYWYQNVAITGWTIVAVTDAVLAVKGGSNAYNVTGGQTAGTWTWPSTTLDATMIPAHTHQLGSRDSTAGDSSSTGGREFIQDYGYAGSGYGVASTSSSIGGGLGHSHGSTTFRPLACIGIICSKDA